MPLQSTSGAASYDGFGGGVPVVPKYIEEYFSTFLYSGTGASQTITNGIDLSTKGGLVWFKDRTTAYVNRLFDTARGTNKVIFSNLTNAESTITNQLTAFNNNGFNLGNDSTAGGVNDNGDSFVSWSWAKAPKFFDVVTYTGTGVSGRTVAHNLGSVPGCMIIKRLDATSNWPTYHRSLSSPQNNAVLLNLTNAAIGAGFWTANPTDTVFSLSGDADVNVNGGSYVAYLFAHDAGGFGLTGTDNVISCGSFTTDGSGNATIDLGYEPQFVLTKSSSITGNWLILDNMRQFDIGGSASLVPNTSGAENSYGGSRSLTNTGFKVNSATNGTYIYIAIRRGPMKVPTSGTSVFSPTAANNSLDTKNTTNFPIDLQLGKYRNIDSNILATDRLRGISTTSTSSGQQLRTPTTNAEDSGLWTRGWDNTGFLTPVAYADTPTILWNFRRAPSFFDEVCYTGTGSNTTFSHNLTVAPELMIVKSRSNSYVSWFVYASALGATKYLILDGTNSASTFSAAWNNTAPTSSVFTVGGAGATNGTGETFVAYLFATCAGVSKVGSVTHVEPTTVSCGFTPRFVLLKSTQDTGTNDWFVFDSARGIVSGNDPYLRLNSTGAENTPFGAADLIDPTADGFIMNGFGGGNYIFLAIA